MHGWAGPYGVGVREAARRRRFDIYIYDDPWDGETECNEWFDALFDYWLRIKVEEGPDGRVRVSWRSEAQANEDGVAGG